MSISLSLAPYCQSCRDFEADVERLDFGSCVTIYIHCAHRNKCQAIKKHLEKELNKNGEST